MLDTVNRPTRVVMIALVVCCASAALADWRHDFVAGRKSEAADTRRAAVAGVDVDSTNGVKALLSVLADANVATTDWYVREAAINRLGLVKSPKAVKLFAKFIKKSLKSLRNPNLDAALVAATGLTGNKDFVAVLLATLEHKKRLTPTVERSTITALAALADLQAVGPTLTVWEKAKAEGDYRTELACADALRSLTAKDFGRNYDAWKAFWDAESEGFIKPSPSSGETDASTVAEKEVKKESKTVARGIELNFTTSGREGALPLLVIHDDAWTPEYFDPYLSTLDDLFKIYTIELPPVSKLKIKKHNIGGYPYYPYDELCDAFEDLRKQRKIKKFALFAHGFSTMVAQRYLSKYGDQVEVVILAGTFPGDDAYGMVLDRLRAKATSMKDKELERAVDFHFITDEKTWKHLYMPTSDKELEALERKFFTIQFANQQDPAIADLWKRAAKPTSKSIKAYALEECQSPPFDVSREKRPSVPVLVISGGKSLWFGPKDGERVAANYPVSQHVVLPNAAMMPWFDDPAGFDKAVRTFMKRYVKN